MLYKGRARCCDQSDNSEPEALANCSGTVNQLKVSALAITSWTVSVERRMNFLTALDRDVDIVIRKKAKSQKGGRILVTAD